MNGDDIATQPTLETVIEMLRSLQADSTDIRSRVANIEAEQRSQAKQLEEIKIEQSRQAKQLEEIKIGQSRQAKQLDKMATHLHGFATDLYQLRLEFGEFRDNVVNALPQLATQK